MAAPIEAKISGVDTTAHSQHNTFVGWVNEFPAEDAQSQPRVRPIPRVRLRGEIGSNPLVQQGTLGSVFVCVECVAEVTTRVVKHEPPYINFFIA